MNLSLICKKSYIKGLSVKGSLSMQGCPGMQQSISCKIQSHFSSTFVVHNSPPPPLGHFVARVFSFVQTGSNIGCPSDLTPTKRQLGQHVRLFAHGSAVEVCLIV